MIIEQELRDKIIQSFREQGFKYNPHIRPPQNDKETYRQLQQVSKIEQLELHKNFLLENLNKAKNYLRNGKDINPKNIQLEFRLVKEGSLEECLFRWWNFIWWSVPYQRGYGRMLRFLLWDKTHESPFGLVSLQSPVLRMSVRDNYLNIPKEELDFWVNQSMQAQRLGALPPYNNLLGGKMSALSIVSNELRNEYQKKYQNKTTLIKNREISNNLLFITTTSAFGRSSVYNRLTFENTIIAKSLGYTQGSGSFHISEKIYLEIIKFLEERGHNVSRGYGNGPSRKVRLIEKGLNLLGLKNATYHNIKREFFLFPLVDNLNEVIGNGSEINYFDRPFAALSEYWLDRWAIPRSERDTSWLGFNANKFILDTSKNYLT